MIVVFDMDNTLTDDLGRHTRPGIVPLLERLQDEGYGLVLWTNSPGERAFSILEARDLARYFDAIVVREDNESWGPNPPKDIRRIGGDFLVDDNPAQIDFVKSIFKAGFLVQPFRVNPVENPTELARLYRAIRRVHLKLRILGWLGGVFRRRR